MALRKRSKKNEEKTKEVKNNVEKVVKEEIKIEEKPAIDTKKKTNNVETLADFLF